MWETLSNRLKNRSYEVADQIPGCVIPGPVFPTATHPPSALLSALGQLKLVRN